MNQKVIRMLNLRDMKTGTDCIVTWVVGIWADALRKKYDVHENDWIHVVENDGRGMIITVHDKRLALSGEIAGSVKVASAA